MTYEGSGRAAAGSCNFIDILKFICAVLVVSIHVPPFSGVNWIVNFGLVNFAARIAVPFFFVSSAYFLFRKAFTEGAFDSSVVIAYIKRILRIYVIWSLIYMPFSYIHMREAGLSAKCFLAIYAKNFIFSSGYGHLWYLNAAGFAYIFLLIVLSLKIRLAFVACFACAMYLIGLCTQSWFGLIEPLRRFPLLWDFLRSVKMLISTARNGLFEGLLFVLIGMFFARHEVKMKMKTAVLCLFGSLAFFAAEAFTLTRIGWAKEYDMYLGLVPTVFFLFCTALNIKLPDAPVYKKLRTLSSLIYFVHMLAAECLMLIPSLGGELSAPFQYLFVFCSSLLLSYIIMRASGRAAWLKCLYK